VRCCLFVGVAPVKRLFFLLLLFSFSGVSSASTISYWSTASGTDPVLNAKRFSSGLLACKGFSGLATYQEIYWNYGQCPNGSGGSFGNVALTSNVNCQYGNTGLFCNTSCNSPSYMQAGQCVTPPPNPCAAKSGQATKWTSEYSSKSAYDSNPIRETASQGGCGVAVGSMQCATSGLTGKFGCWGTGVYSGQEQAPTVGGVANCAEPCQPPEPTTSDSSQSCTAPQVNNGTTSYTCNTESSASEFAGSNCAVGTVNGVTALHCTRPDYVPEAETNTRTDEVSETTNADGSKTTTTTSTTNNTYCQAGACTTTTTTTTTTSGTDAEGNPTGQQTTCTGDDCEEPEDPEEGEFPGSREMPDTAEAFPEIDPDGDTPDYGASSQAFFERLQSAPIVSALTSLTVPSGGSCNIGSAQLFGGSVSFNHFCDMAPQVLSGLRYLFLAIWAWAAIRLFFTA
jgi:hypothetical protein